MGSKKIGAIVSIVFGVIILLGSILTGTVLLHMAPRLLREAAQLPVPGEKGYHGFIDTRDSTIAPTYYTYYLYDVQNVDAISAATSFADLPKPVVVEKGPYTYIEYCYRDNVKYTDGNQEVAYNEMCWKEFEPTMSIDASGKQLSEKDVVTLPYPQVVGPTLIGGNGPLAPPLMGGSVVLGTFCSQLRTAGLAADDAAKLFFAAAPATCDDMSPGKCPLATLLAEKEPVYDFRYNGTTLETNIAGTPDVLAVFGADAATALTTFTNWFTKLFYCDGADENCHAIHTSHCLGNNCGAVFVKLAKMLDTNPTEGALALGLLFGVDMSSAAAQNQAKYFAQYFLQRYGALFQPAFDAQGACLAPEQCADLSANHMFTKRSVRSQILQGAGDPFNLLLGVNAQGGISSQTDCPVTFDEHGPDNTAPLDFNACYQEWKALPDSKDVYAERTGRQDAMQIELITQYKSLGFLPKHNDTDHSGYWKVDVPLRGTRNPNFPSSGKAKNLRLQPVINPSFKPRVFNSDTLRDVSFKYRQKSAVKGVKSLQYAPDMYSLIDPKGADPAFEVTEYGVFDLTTPKNTPIALTFNNYLYSSWTDNPNVKIADMIAPDYDRDMVLLDIEPLTGKTIRANFQLTIHLKVPVGLPGISGNPVNDQSPGLYNNTQFIAYPMVRMSKHSQLTDKNAKDLKTAQNLLDTMPKPAVIFGTIIGLALLGLGGFLIFKLRQERKRIASVNGEHNDVQSALYNYESMN